MAGWMATGRLECSPFLMLNVFTHMLFCVFSGTSFTFQSRFTQWPRRYWGKRVSTLSLWPKHVQHVSHAQFSQNGPIDIFTIFQIWPRTMVSGQGHPSSKVIFIFLTTLQYVLLIWPPTPTQRTQSDKENVKIIRGHLRSNVKMTYLHDILYFTKYWS